MKYQSVGNILELRLHIGWHLGKLLFEYSRISQVWYMLL